MSSLDRIVFFTLIALPSSSLAERSDVLPQVEVVDSRLPSDERIPPAIDRRLERADIDQRVPADTDELLQSFPSVDVSRAGGVGGLTFVSIRGGDPNFTLFMLDGIKLNDPTNSRGGGLDLYMIPQQMIDAIEVSPRPASAIQGSDGLGGIVNISTRPVSGAHLRGDLSDHDSTSFAVSLGGDVSDQLLGSLTLGHEDKSSGVEGDMLRQSYFLGRASADPTNRIGLDFVSFVVDGEASSFPEDSGGDRLAVIRAPETRDYRREVYGINGAWDVRERLTLKGSGSYTYHREETDNPGIAAGVWDGVPGVSGKRTYHHFDSQLYLVAQPVHKLSVTAGFAYDREEGSSDDVINFGGFTVPADFDLDRSSWSVFTELGYRVTPELTVQSGLRHDMPDSASDESSFSFSVGYEIPEADMMISANYGEGYKLPSMFALGHSLVGNPDLSPEYSEAIDLGVRKRWPAKGIEAGLSLFWNEYRDMIDFDPVGFTNINRGRVEVDGVDLQLGWQAGRDVAANLHLTYSDTDIVGSSEELRRRPEWKGGAEVRWTPDSQFSWVVSADYTGEFFDSSIPTGVVEMPSFWRVNTAINWRYTQDTQVSLGIKNLLDDDYEESIGFSNGGVTAILGLSVTI